MRLTRFNKLTNEYEYHLFNPNTSMIEDEIAGTQKLGQLEDVEEELGIELLTLIKVLTSTVYLYHNGKLTECEQAPCLLCFDNEYCLEYHFEHDVEQVYLKDYGKTWALTKEELL